MQNALRWALAPAVVVALALAIQGTSAQEMGMKIEIKTAITHAGFASKYDSLNEVTLHLHHVVNCLVGPDDKLFDKAAGNPCQGQGKGVLPEIKASMGTDQEYNVAWWLAHLGDEAIAMKNLAQAKAAAHIIEVQLTSMSKM
ncbi:MAG: hypothetical protein E6H00_07725 [Bacillati bacterium ANGP1]|uniref:Uncharacterized protein n=1 Tax=Candidatus Segetimicrobium genomatis TaxID=2569760 RepID=A0A537K2R1_9BACT|nr:MAG: hypothetical protein E6H00_07725 [Terrabacteria group bacterium ANGP1]